MYIRTILAFDFGIKNIGVAIGQNITCTAHCLCALKAKNGIPDWRIFDRLLKEWLPHEIVVGLPLNMDGSEQPITYLARNFARKIKQRYSINVHLHDERLSTIQACSELFEYGGFRALSKNKIDSTSAVIILESYLNK